MSDDALGRLIGRQLEDIDSLKEYDSTQPEGGRWHTELLNQVADQTGPRPALLSEESRQRLRNYLAFRHRSRHSSVNSLAWDPMAHLVADLPQTWNTVRAEILKFLQGQQSSADPE